MKMIEKLGIINSLVADPPKVVELDYMWGELSLTMGHPVNPYEFRLSRTQGKFSYPRGYHPARFSILGNRAVVRGNEWAIQDEIKYFNGWLLIAIREYGEMMRQSIKDEEKRKREELHEEI